LIYRITHIKVNGSAMHIHRHSLETGNKDMFKT